MLVGSMGRLADMKIGKRVAKWMTKPSTLYHQIQAHYRRRIMTIHQDETVLVTIRNRNQKNLLPTTRIRKWQIMQCFFSYFIYCTMRPSTPPWRATQDPSHLNNNVIVDIAPIASRALALRSLMNGHSLPKCIKL